MQISATVNTYELEQSLHILAKEARVLPGQVLREETRLLGRNIQQITPPMSHAQGREAIRQDLFGGKRKGGGRYSSVGLFQMIGNSTQVPPRKQGSETVGVNLGWEHSKTIRIMRKMWRPDASMAEMAEFHKKHQNPKTGRTGYVSQSTIGRWKVQDQMWIKDAVAKKYLAMIQSRVGWAKGAWTSMINAAGGSVQNWISRHSARAGTVSANWGVNPHVLAIAHDIKIPGYQRVLDNAVKQRVIVTQRKIERLFAGRATNLGFVTIRGRG